MRCWHAPTAAVPVWSGSPATGVHRTAGCAAIATPRAAQLSASRNPPNIIWPVMSWASTWVYTAHTKKYDQARSGGNAYCRYPQAHDESQGSQCLQGADRKPQPRHRHARARHPGQNRREVNQRRDTRESIEGDRSECHDQICGVHRVLLGEFISSVSSQSLWPTVPLDVPSATGSGWTGSSR